MAWIVRRKVIDWRKVWRQYDKWCGWQLSWPVKDEKRKIRKLVEAQLEMAKLPTTKVNPKKR